MNKTLQRAYELEDKLNRANIDLKDIALVITESDNDELRKGDMIYPNNSIKDIKTLNGMRIMVVPDKPKEVPFTYETMPFPCILKRECYHSNNEIHYIAITKDQKGVRIFAPGDITNVITWSELAENWKWQPLQNERFGDAESGGFGKIWQPCRKQVKP